MTASLRRICALRVLLVGSWWLLLSRPVIGAPDSSEITTPQGPATPGKLKFADRCQQDNDCGFVGSYCEPRTKKCNCKEEFPATNHIDKCGVKANINESCFFREQCESMVKQTECRDGRCICIFEMIPVPRYDGEIECIAEHKEPPSLQYVDPAMIWVLVAMALMFIILCVVLRLFSKARWRENRTIFNTPNPRLMNVSLLRDSKLLHGQERRGSRGSVRGPSRQPSVASLRAHSPSASQGAKNSQRVNRSRTGSRRGSRGSTGNASATSTRSNKSPPATQPSNITVEIQDAAVA
ncbi:uncharacterized protein LOC124187978 isoform X1 [Neodiprion fabricii]|uniref:uncharacterized protein LOC124187978 isoform X1 n=1 Tax=Neodiprion fabricii TaxID=2872261 RepID=UPI001ED8E320|nr:uncharacterized protein LOC124187978 isoform X1 [Neodiprion fabricii]XP_046436153.1 uncharacterized protein LOC124187978 isoform X1 [Neodiprion fabricii]